MKPASDRTMPRRLTVPISRHFLPVLQPEPLAWLTTGLMKGSRRPFALYLPSEAAGCSAASDSPPSAWPPPAISFSWSAGFAAGAGAGAGTAAGTATIAFNDPTCRRCGFAATDALVVAGCNAIDFADGAAAGFFTGAGAAL